MSIDELEQGYSTGPSRPSFDRTPPQDIAAEQSVLGGMMISKDAIADVVEQLRGTDFYRPAHEAVYDAILDLYGRGEPADAVTVSAELTKRGEMSRIGGAPYLHTLISMVPTAANAGYYARIVRERAVLRRLVEAGTRIVQLGYATEGGDVDEIVNNAQAEVYAVTEQRSSEDYLRLGDVIGGTVDEIEAAGHRGDGMVGVPTGFADLDRLTNGLHPGQMIVLAARPAIGKALALDTVLPTPTGWTTMGEVRVGDALLAADGTTTLVVGATDVMVDRPCYEVTFDDGSVLIADALHEWSTTTRASRRTAGAPAEIRTTEEIAATVRCATAERRANHAVRIAMPLALPEATLPLDPYALGVWLGEGNSASARFAAADPEIAMRIEGRGLVAREVTSPPGEARLYALQFPPLDPIVPESCHRDHGTVAGVLRGLEVLNNKHIPLAYLRASESQRRALLAGLLDTDGTVNPTGSPQFTVTSRRLAEDFRELVHSLGYRTGWSSRQVRGRSDASSTAFTTTFTTDDDVFALERKRLVHKDRRRVSTPRLKQRFIVSAVEVASVPVRCVEIDHADHLYLAGRSMIPTHNSTMGLDIARSASIKHGMASVIFSLEMSRNEITMRLLSAEGSIPLQKMRNGTMGDVEWQKLAATMGRISEAPLFIDDSPNMSLMEIRAKCRRLKQKHDLKLVIIDYLQLMSSGKRVESRQQEVSEFSRALKLLAKELEVPVIAISQLNRGAEQRTDKKPAMSDLRESGSIEQDADIVMLLHREDAYERESPRAGEADLIVAKHRNGPTDVITVAFQGHMSRFVDMQSN
ncbi:MAG: replicative DNA helicase [Cellulomonas sp.]